MIEYFVEYITSILYSHFNDIMTNFEELENLVLKEVEDEIESEEEEEEYEDTENE